MRYDLLRRPSLLAAAFLALFAVLYRDLLTGGSVFSHDTLVWYGTFHHYVTSLAAGEFPYWDPYLISGTPFYPNIPLHGLLDPLVLIWVPAVKFLGVSPLTAYVLFRVLRLLLFTGGSYLFFRTVSGHRTGSLVAAGVLLLAAPHSYFPQFGTVDTVYLVPYAMHFLLSFLERPQGPRRALHLAGLAIATGLSMVVYVPSFFLFNLAVLLLGVAVFRTVPFRPVIEAFRSPRLAAYAAACLLATGLMAAPPAATMLKDASGGGELFPMQRIVQKNDRVFKQIVATDVDTGSLSEKFTDNRGIFNSWGNVVGMLTPDVPHWIGDDLTSYIHQYLGILPLLLIIIGIWLGPARWRWLLLAMTAVHFVNGFSATGVHDQPFNAVQRFFNAAFPPLALYQGRENFGYFVMLFLGAFLARGIAVLVDRPEVLAQRRRALLLLCCGLMALKAMLAGAFAGSFPATSLVDLFALLQLAAAAVLLLLFVRGRVSQGALLLIFLLLTATDLSVVNLRYQQDILRDRAPFTRTLPADMVRVPEPFPYFREPAVITSLRQPLAFEETIQRIPGALSLGFNHSLFTTKRYYDFFTHVPPETQFLLNGMVLPVVQFFPLDRSVPVRSKQELLRWYASATEEAVARTLFVEEPAAAARHEQVGDFAGYPDAPWLLPDLLLDRARSFLDANAALIGSLRAQVRGSVVSSEAVVTASSLSGSGVSVRVVNREEGFLLYADGWSRYWRAFDNGREVPVLIGNYAFKAVRLGPGEHTVRFLYDPAHYKAGLVAFYGGLLSAILLLVAAARRTRRSAHQPAGGS